MAVTGASLFDLGGAINGYSVETLGFGSWSRLPTAAKVKALENEVAKTLPRVWVPAIRRKAKAAGADLFDQAAVYIRWLVKYGGAKAADMSEADLRDKAALYAKQASQEDFTRIIRGSSYCLDAMLSMYEHIEAFLIKRLVVAKIPRICGAAGLDGLIKRLECAAWWRRALRRLVARAYEMGCFELGLVGAKAGAWYCSDRAVIRRRQQNAANALMMAKSKIRNQSGETMTLQDVAKLSVSNKAIRRGELMTRIRGCEDWADSQGLVGLFTTMTLPGRFHSQKHGGGKNRKYKIDNAVSPADGQAWLCRQWGLVGSALARHGIKLIGFRVAEPHHDGCPHWHMLIWCKPEDKFRVEAMLLRYWYIEPENGMVANRVKIIGMVKGMAAGYVAKYIAKNIDDISTATHTDDQAGAAAYAGLDLLGDVPVKPSDRVEAWAALWHIRQFQGFGQPSVTVWRDLRKVDKRAAAGGSDKFIAAWLAVHKTKDKRADWCAYMQAQGGAMLARKDYRLCVHAIEKTKRGRYGVVRAMWSCGVLDRSSRLGAVPTKRQLWVKDSVGCESAFATVGRTWTRLNNSAQINKSEIAPTLFAFYASKVWDPESKPLGFDRHGDRRIRPPLGRNEKEFNETACI